MTGSVEVGAGQPQVVRRLGVVMAGVGAAVAVWAIARALGVELRQPGFGGAAPRALTVAPVVFASLVGGLLAWAVLVVVQRVTERGQTWWLAIAGTALLLSLGGPLSGSRVSGGNRVVLVSLHLAVAAIVIPGLYRTFAKVRRTRLEES